MFFQNSLKTREGLAVKILQPGIYNTDAGPDFQLARIKIGDSIWVGHVEVHIKSSDWYKHGHQTDPAYDQVILHVVHVDDKPVMTSQGNIIPTISLRFDHSYYQNFIQMINQIKPIPCESKWMKVPSIQIEAAISSLGAERMEARFRWLNQKLSENRGGWKDLYLQVFFRAFGFGKNQENFELLAQSIPYELIQKYNSNLFQLESLIFGQAGLIPEWANEPYPRALKMEFRYLAQKHRLERKSAIFWNSRRTRPANQPVWRLAQLAGWLHDIPDLFQFIREKGISGSLLSADYFMSSYWKSHSDFGKAGPTPSAEIGIAALELIQINAVLPLNAFYNFCHADGNPISDWLDTLENIEPENNTVVKLWSSAGFRVPSAFYSQAFLYIYKNLCTHRLCLRCQIGQLIIKL